MALAMAPPFASSSSSSSSSSYYYSASSTICSSGLRNLNSERQMRADKRKLPVRLRNFVSGSKSGLGHLRNGSCFRVKASSNCFFNPNDEPILKEALKEPVAFVGGMFAGLLRLDLNEEPLKEWVTRTADASGIAEEIDADGSKTDDDDVPRQIEIN